MTNPTTSKCELRAEVVRWRTTHLYIWTGTLCGAELIGKTPREHEAECRQDIGEFVRSLDGRGVVLKKAKKK